MFLSYLALAQELEQEPRFYNTLTSNCTTAVWRLARSLKPDLPIDRRLVLSGRLPDYLTDLGVIAAAPAAERDAAALITPLGQRFDGTKPFSDLIRGR
ncbi:lipoprotein N-acyltransferase Lnb domain-containing protein [Rhodobacter capsulatus]